jgi:hypothetical protein
MLKAAKMVIEQCSPRCLAGYGVISNLKKVTEVPEMYMSDHLLWTTSELSWSFSTKFFLQQNGILSLSSFWICLWTRISFIVFVVIVSTTNVIWRPIQSYQRSFRSWFWAKDLFSLQAIALYSMKMADNIELGTTSSMSDIFTVGSPHK